MTCPVADRLYKTSWIYVKWQECLDRNEGELLKKITCIDGKTMRENKRNEERPLHIVSAWSKEDGFCLGQKAIGKKSNEITAIPDLLDRIQVKGQVVTIDAMGTQFVIAEKIGSIIKVGARFITCPQLLL